MGRIPNMGTPDLPSHWFQILLTLADQDRHGLAITKDVFDRTEGRMHLWPGKLYGALKQMSGRGLIDEIDPPRGFASGGGRPRFYRITALGRRACAAEAARLARFVDVAQSKRLIKRPGTT
jgi:DNA-binding PadR family transcriptional regulator